MNNSKYQTSPIIVSGMHRSGTSLIANILIKCNIFMGSKVDENQESIFFQRINRWLFSCLGSSWNNPQSFHDLNVKDLKILTLRIENILNSKINNFLYFGTKKNIFKNNFSNINKWGWKDPSNTFTLPIWLNVFPNARVVFIIRHPLDISLSLLKRQYELSEIDTLNNNSFFLSKYLPVLPIAKGDILSVFNIKSIDDCLHLINKYYEEIYFFSKKYNNILIIKYEDLLMNTNQIMMTICNYIKESVPDDIINSISKNIDGDKVYSYKNKNITKFNHELLSMNRFYRDE